MYLWIKAFHIISVIAWMAALLYLPRLFVYHSMVEAGSARAETFALMERRLQRAIMTPAMLASFLFGIWMVALNPGLLQEGWFQIKLALALVMAGCHGAFASMRRKLADGTATRSTRSYRVWNEVPTVLMVAIVVLAVVKPS